MFSNSSSPLFRHSLIKVPEAILASLSSAFDTAPSELVYLGGGRLDSDGIVYIFPHAEGDRVLKILALSGRDPFALLRLEERLKFMHFLGDQGAPIVYPLAQPDGSLYYAQNEEEHQFVAYTYRKIQGGSASKMRWLEAIARPWGAAVGKLHRLTQNYPTWQSSPTPSGCEILGWREEWQGFYDGCRDREVKNRWLSIRERLEALPVQRDSFGFVHNDPHSGNILVQENRVVLLDFDVANYHWFINDIAITLQSLLYMQTGGLDRPLVSAEPLRRFLEIFMDGYAWENSLDPSWLNQIDLFIAYRRILGFIVMQDWLRSKPSQRLTLKKMILEEPAILG
jgi:Ser/Thr protein kinase RdoA (MazF antagonist)